MEALQKLQGQPSGIQNFIFKVKSEKLLTFCNVCWYQIPNFWSTVF